MFDWFGGVAEPLNLKCTEQNSANEQEHGAHGQYIYAQGKVHGMCLPR